MKPRYIHNFSRHIKFTASAVIAMTFALVAQSSAQSFQYWEGGTVDLAGSGNSVSAGGDGLWDTTIKNWDAGAVPYVAWDNSANNFAAFGGTGPYTLTLGADVTVGGFAFNASGGATTITPGAGPYSVNLGGTTVNVSFNNARLGVISANLNAGTSNLVVGSTTGSAGGILTLSGAVTGTGTTTISNGTVLKLSGDSSLTSGNLTLASGGILGLDNGNFSRGVGTGAGQVRWSGNGGFAAFGENRTVQFSGSSINWNATNFIGNNQLLLGHATADATLIWGQAISTAGGNRTVNVANGSAAIDAIMSAVIAGGTSTSATTSNAFNKAGTGTLAFTAQNTHWGNTNINAGTLMIGHGGATGGLSQNTFNINVASGATLAANRSNTLTQGTNALVTVISGAGNFAQVGAGTTILTLANTYQGTTTVSNGILRVNGTHTGGAAYTVAAAGTLQGTGSTESVLNISGTLSPGASVESFASGTVNLFNDSIFEYEVDSSVATGVGADLQVITGDLNLTGTVTLTLGDLASLPTAFALGTTFSLINYSGDWNAGLFTFGGDEIVNGGTFTAGLNTWQLDYDAAAGLNFIDDHHLIDSSFVNITSVIPEPSAALLGALGMLVLLRRRRF